MILVIVGVSDPVRGPHPVRASGQEKEIQGGMMGKSDGAEVLVADVMQTSDPRRPALEAQLNLSLNVSDALRAMRAE